MIIISRKEDCCGCFSCVNSCHHDAIKMKYDDEGFLYPKTDLDNCIECKLCEMVCPITNDLKEDYFSNAYVAINKNLKERLNSSSGGIFYSIAKEIIADEGLVFGVKWDSKFKTIHSHAESLNEVKEFMGSKYIQSKLGENTFKTVKLFLKEGRKVLFTGTPCQIKALKLFLRRDYKNLLTVDLLCHGVPSYLLFNSYKKYLEEKHGGEIESFTFRDKHGGWREYNLSFKINGEIHYESSISDLFISNFRGDLFLRPSCYDCRVKNFTSGSDITIGDYWGVEGIHEEFDDNKGTSLIITHTEKGENFLNKIGSELKFKKTDLEYASKFNRAIENSGVLKESRKYIYEKIKNKDFKTAIEESKEYDLN